MAIVDALENRRLLIAQPFMMIAGILAYRTTKFEPSPVALIAVAALIGFLAFISRRGTTIRPVALLSIAFWIGFSLLSIHGTLFGTPMLRGVSFGQYQVRVDAIHSNDGERARLIISAISSTNERRAPDIRRARILVPSDQVPEIGTIISAPMRLYRVPGPVVPGGFDSQFHAYFDGIGAFGSTTGEITLVDKARTGGFFSFVQATRDNIGKRIDLALDPPASGIARALIIGDQGQIDENIRNNLAAAGLAHVLAISGLHLSLVAGGVFAAFRLLLASSYTLGQRFNIKKIAALAGVSAALIYLALSGASVSAIRATLMLLLVFGAVLAGRRALTMRNVAFAAIFVILVDPASIFRPSFQLSFAAVTALVGTYEGYRQQTNSEQGPLRKILTFALGTGLTSIIAGAATALFAAYHFQQIAPFGVLGNIVAIPLVAFVILPAALVGVLLMPLGIEAMFLRVMGWGIEQIIAVAQFIAKLGDGIISAPILGPLALLIGLTALAWFAFFPKKLRLLALVAAIPLLVLFGGLPRPDIMIADTTLALAVRQEGQLNLLAGRTNTFAVNAWSETFLEPIEKSDNQSCDSSGCILVRENFTLAVAKSRDAFEEDCRTADLVVARLNAPAFCSALTQTIDRTNLDQQGVHWAKWTGTQFWIRPAITDIYRPWRPVFD